MSGSEAPKMSHEAVRWFERHHSDILRWFEQHHSDIL